MHVIYSAFIKKMLLQIAAPRIDIEFWKAINDFDYVDYAKTARKAFEKHLWYMSPRNIAFAFFDDMVTTEEKEAMRKAFLSRIAEKTENGKRKIIQTTPTRATSINSSDTLSSFITADTKEFFEIMNISTSFLMNSAKKWSGDKCYLDAKQLVASLVVVNDVAERGVKLITDFNMKSTRDPVQQQYLLQVIEYHRKKYPMLQ